MSGPFHIVIVGAGPAGLSAALAIAQHPSSSHPVRITVLELRDAPHTIGGAVNMTPLALRYLDALGAGPRLRPRGHAGSAIEMVAHRTGALLATLWPDVDALRVRRQDVVESLTETALQDVDPSVLQIVYGAKVQSLEEHGDGDDGGVRVTYTSRTAQDPVVVDADVVLGCDGIHSFVRRTFVEPDRPETYTGKCVAYGFIATSPADDEEGARWTRRDGEPLVRHTTLVQHGAESLLLARYRPETATEEQQGLYLAAVMPVAAKGSSADRAGWAVQDKEALRTQIRDVFAGSSIACLEEIVARCEDWFFYPVHMLPPGGVWSKGRVLLLGDAAHAVSYSPLILPISSNEVGTRPGAIILQVLTVGCSHRCLHRAKAPASPSRTACSSRTSYPGVRRAAYRRCSPTTRLCAGPTSRRCTRRRWHGGIRRRRRAGSAASGWSTWPGSW